VAQRSALMLRAVVRVDPRAVTHKCVGARPSIHI
jgi:hypothetical protein